MAKDREHAASRRTGPGVLTTGPTRPSLEAQSIRNASLFALLATTLAAGLVLLDLGAAQSGAGHWPIVAPPAGAHLSPHGVQPFETIGSPYLHTAVSTYASPLAPQAVLEYYLPRLRGLGYRLSGQGTSGRYGTVLSYDWQFSRGAGMDDTVLLTVEPKGSGTLYSVTRELIVAPPRPKGSIVPHDVRQVIVLARRAAGEAWVSRTLKIPVAWREILGVVNALPVDTRGVHGCVADFGAAAKVVFTTGQGNYAFTEDPACDSVAGPAGAHLQDAGMKLWRTVIALTGVPVSQAPQPTQNAAVSPPSLP